MKKWILGILVAGILFNFNTPVHAEVEQAKVKVTILTASNQGNDFDIVNDAFRDRLIKLFAYSSYHQIKEETVDLSKAERRHMDLPGKYELILTLHGLEKERVLVQAMVRKDNKQYVDTVLSILKPGVVFLGGPSADEGDLIIVLETGF